MRLIGFLFALLMLAVPAWAVEARIVGPDKANPGDLVVLSGTDSVDATDYEWQLVQSDKTFLAVDDGQRVVFATGQQGVYCFILAVAGEGAEGEPEVSIAVHCVTVGQPVPPPPPPPPPPPDPDDLTGFAKQVFERAKKIDEKDVAKQFAESYSTSLSAIAAGAYNNMSIDEASRKIVSDLFDRNDPVTDDHPKWDAFFKDLADWMDAFDKDGEFKTLADITKRLTEIRDGLEAASK